MKNIVFIFLVAAFVALWFVLRKINKEAFVPEFLDQSNVMKTSKTRQSSYRQETNHFTPMANPQEPIEGSESPFRVNMFNSYMV
jgi:hypothetical protein